MAPTPDREPLPYIDPSVPSMARAYDFMLGGKDNYLADRAFIESAEKRMPGVHLTAKLNRAFVIRAVRYLAAELGFTQFLDLGSGLPTVENVHQVAQRYTPTAKVVYVDNDPSVLAHGRSLLESNPYTVYVQADLRDADEVIGEAGGWLDFLEPVAVLATGVLFFVQESPGEVMGAYAEHLVPGSALAITHTSSEHLPKAIQDEMRTAYPTGGTATGMVPRGIPEIMGAFCGWPLVEPGLVNVVDWKPDGPGGDTVLPMLGGMAIRP